MLCFDCFFYLHYWICYDIPSIIVLALQLIKNLQRNLLINIINIYYLLCTRYCTNHTIISIFNIIKDYKHIIYNNNSNYLLNAYCVPHFAKHFVYIFS